MWKPIWDWWRDSVGNNWKNKSTSIIGLIRWVRFDKLYKINLEDCIWAKVNTKY